MATTPKVLRTELAHCVLLRALPQNFRNKKRRPHVATRTEVRCLQVGTPLSGFEAPSPPLDWVTSTPFSGFTDLKAMIVPEANNRELLHKQ
jgi:hypothetical protein